MFLAFLHYSMSIKKVSSKVQPIQLLELVKDRITVDSTEEDIELILEDIDEKKLYKHLIFDSAKNNTIFFRKTMFEEVSKVRNDDDEFCQVLNLV